MSEQTEEIWRDIPGYSGYQASNLGRIRSLDRMTPYTRKDIPGKVCYYPRKGQILTQVEDGGYLKTHLGWTHRLIAETFLGPMPEDCTEVNHIDENKQNNRPENLEWMSHSENVKYGQGYVNRINSQKRTWLLKKLKEINADLVWKKVSELVELFS